MLPPPPPKATPYAVVGNRTMGTQPVCKSGCRSCISSLGSTIEKSPEHSPIGGKKMMSLMKRTLKIVTSRVVVNDTCLEVAILGDSVVLVVLVLVVSLSRPIVVLKKPWLVVVVFFRAHDIMVVTCDSVVCA